MPYASCLVPCSVVWRCSLLLSCLDAFSFEELCLSKDLGLWSLFYLGYICIALWNSLSGLCAFWDSLSSFTGPWLGNCILGWPVWSVTSYPLLGVHPTISILKFIMIGCHCKGLDGQLIYQASGHWLFSGTTMHQLCDQWLCHSARSSFREIMHTLLNNKDHDCFSSKCNLSVYS